LQLLLNLAERAKLRTKMNAMFAGAECLVFICFGCVQLLPHGLQAPADHRSLPVQPSSAAVSLKPHCSYQ